MEHPDSEVQRTTAPSTAHRAATPFTRPASRSSVDRGLENGGHVNKRRPSRSPSGIDNEVRHTNLRDTPSRRARARCSAADRLRWSGDADLLGQRSGVHRL